MFNKIINYLRIYFRKEIRIVNRSHNSIPKYETLLSAGVDLMSNEDGIVIKPFDRRLVKTGLFIELPRNMEAQIRPRSGLALKKGISIVNSPGTIDADYRGEIGIILMNNTVENFEINIGDRIAQMVFAKVERIKWKEVEVLNETKRGGGGFGSTGK